MALDRLLLTALLLGPGAPALAQDLPDGGGPAEEEEPLPAEPVELATPVALATGAGQGNPPRDAEEVYGVPRATPAWSALSLDVDGDFVDELAVVSHRPVLWLRPGLNGVYTPSMKDHPWGGVPGDRHGLTACDVDRDGDLELVVGSGGARGKGGKPAELWERGPDGVWVDRGPEQLALTQGARMRGVSCVDVDGDGAPELYLPVVGGDRGDMLLRRQPDGSWVDQAPALGLDSLEGTLGGLWGDLNSDGRIDLVRVTNNQAQVLFQGEDGRFNRQEALAGLVPATAIHVFDVALLDADSDGDLDLYVARALPAFDAARDGYLQLVSHGGRTEGASWRLPKGCNVVGFRVQGTLDSGPVTLITGEGPQRVVGRLRVAEPFTQPIPAEQGVVAWIDEEKRLLHVEARQVRGEVFLGLSCKGQEVLPRLAKTDVSAPLESVDNADLLLRNDGAGGFEPWPGFVAPLQNTLDVLALDVDLDGDTDLFTVGGLEPGTGLNVPDALLENDGSGSFSASPRWSPPDQEPPLEGRLALPVTLNADAYPDLLIFNGHHDGLLAGQVVSWVNPGGEARWVDVVVKDGAARSVSATVTVLAPDLAPQVRSANPSPDWRANGAGTQRFGVGQAERVKVVVTWPDGTRVVRRRVKVGQTQVVERP